MKNDSFGDGKNLGKRCRKIVYVYLSLFKDLEIMDKLKFLEVYFGDNSISDFEREFEGSNINDDQYQKIIEILSNLSKLINVDLCV